MRLYSDVVEGSEMEISEAGSCVRRSSRTKTVKRMFEIETKGCSTTNNKPAVGVKMKGGDPSVTATDFVIPKNIKRSSNDEVPKRKVMSALHNLGNTCFLNSVLQVLYHTPQFQDKITLLGSEVKSTLLALDLFQQLNYDGMDITHGIGWSLVTRLSELLNQMKKIDDDIAQGIVIRFPAIRPYNLLETIEEINSEFKGNLQQDAHELLKCVLMNVDEASNELNACRSQLKLCIGDRARERNLSQETEGSDSSQFYFGCEDHFLVDKDDEDLSAEMKSFRVADCQFPESQVSFICLSPSVKKSQKNFRDCCIQLPRLDSPLGMRDANITTRATSNLVTELFQGMMSLKTKCLRCLKETERKEEFQDISLPIKQPADSSNKSNSGADHKNKRVSVLQLILSIRDEVERLDDENCYYCESCQRLVTAERRLCYELLPNVLTIHLKRFAMHSSSSFTKTFDRVDIPLELPCLESKCRSQGGSCHRYSLYGIVCHAGKSLVSGHYTSYVKVQPNNKMGSPCTPLSQSPKKGSPNTVSPFGASLMERMSAGKHCDSDSSLISSGQPDDSIGYFGTPSGKSCSFMNGCVTMHDISISSGSRSESRNSVMSDLASSNEDPGGDFQFCNSERPKKKLRSHCTRSTTNCTKSEVDACTSILRETDRLFDSGDDSLWYKCNDANITEMTKQQLASLLTSSGNITPYMLFYHKVPPPTL